MSNFFLVEKKKKNISGAPVLTLSIGTDGALSRCVDPDQILQNGVSNQGLHCLSLIKLYFRQINW